MEIKENNTHFSALWRSISKLWTGHKLPICITAAVLALCLTVSAGTALALKEKPEYIPITDSSVPAGETAESFSEPSVISESSEETVAPEPIASTVSESSACVPESSAAVSSETKKPAAENTSVKKEQTSSTANKPIAVGYKYNSNSDIDDNVFLDALIYTGYNINKHRSDGKMWQYILAAHKRGLGYLSNITYAGGSSGYETANGKPDIKYFEKHGLVCASYVTYVYFNYLPNVAGIDTSALPKPARSISANDWYTALKQWESKGYSRRISFTASKTSSGFINFKASENIPIGSIIVCCDAKNRSDYGSHVSIYAGYKNNYHWITHVGNANGPEFCAVERLHFGPDPQWPIAVFTTPNNIRMSALLEVNVTDGSGKPVSGANFTLKNSKSGAVLNLGASNGKAIVKDGLSYGDYTLSYTVPAGYTAESTTKDLKLTTANNSKNTVNITLLAIPPAPAENSETQSASDKTDSSSVIPSIGNSETESASIVSSDTVETASAGEASADSSVNTPVEISSETEAVSENNPSISQPSESNSKTETPSQSNPSISEHSESGSEAETASENNSDNTASTASYGLSTQTEQQ